MVDGSHGRLTTRSRSLDKYPHGSHSIFLSLARSTLGCHLRCIGCTLFRSLKSRHPRCCPADHIALHIGEGDRGVIKRSPNMGHSGWNVLFFLFFRRPAFCFGHVLLRIRFVTLWLLFLLLPDHCPSRPFPGPGIRTRSLPAKRKMSFMSFSPVASDFH